MGESVEDVEEYKGRIYDQSIDMHYVNEYSEIHYLAQLICVNKYFKITCYLHFIFK